MTTTRDDFGRTVQRRRRRGRPGRLRVLPGAGRRAPRDGAGPPSHLRPAGRSRRPPEPDIGCGTGTALAELAARGISGTGVDRSTAMVDTARLRHPDLPFATGDALELPFPEGSLSWYRAERVYLHLADAAAAIAEARRVLVPGGRIVLADPDFDSVVLTGGDPSLTRTLIAGFTDSLANGHAGTRTMADLAAAGFRDIRVDAVPLTFTSLPVAEPLWLLPALAHAAATGLATAERTARWHADLRDRADRGAFLGAVTLFVLRATPGLIRRRGVSRFRLRFRLTGERRPRKRRRRRSGRQ
ncbi:methyltransferase domain-containing protein [Yinghuangia aomiensis]